MRVEYSKRAIADLRQIAAYYSRSGNSAIAPRFAERIQAVIARIAVSPLSGRAVVRRPGVRVALLPNYRYKIFYRVTEPDVATEMVISKEETFGPVAPALPLQDR
jgi:plasmid stabilization system protein ParE